MLIAAMMGSGAINLKSSEPWIIGDGPFSLLAPT